jgi:LPS-assembly protein
VLNRPGKTTAKQTTLQIQCLCIIAVAWAVPAQATDDAWSYCAPSPAASSAVQKSTAGKPEDTAMRFTADEVSKHGDEYRFQGKVVGERGVQRLEAERLFYNEQTDQARAEGEVRYQVGNRLLTSDTANLQLKKDTGQFSPARFWLTDKHIRGQADVVDLQGATVTELQGAQFTTCDEGDSAWLLKASSLRLDTEANEGIARHARIEFMHVPIFYFPYLSFPLQGRKTGFLVPSFGESTVAGTELSVPWYWNIAPQWDATLTPRFMSKRGVLLEGEFRYLNERSQGQLDVAHLSDDRVFDDDRSALHFQHAGESASGWRTRVDYRFASDDEYLDDFGNSLATASVTHLERRGELNYQAQNWRASLLLQGYQTLDNTLPATSRPYQRLPQLQLSTRSWTGLAGLQWGLNAEAVQFDRAEGVVASRVDLQPHVSWPLRMAAGFLVPKLTLRHTQYALQKNDPNTDAQPSRSLPLFSLDSGLIFERDLSAVGRAVRQTLEPRLYYLYVPKKEQQNLIVDESSTSRVFDSSLPLFGIDQLFRENRFNGADRIGDANQLSAALSTRFFDAQGRELLSASLGRIFYFQDREVTLPGAAVETDKASNWLAQLKSHWTPTMTARASLQWDEKDSELDRGTLDWRYQQDRHRVLRLAYRFERETLKQVDVAGIWPVTTRWHVVGRWLRSIKDQTTLETLKGIEYESCCWSVRIVQREYRADAAVDELSDSIWVQLELKGLTSVGRKVENLLARDILAP